MENLNLIIEQIREIYGTRDFIPLHSPKFGGKEKVYLEHCIETSFVSSVGKFVDQFESEIAQIAKTDSLIGHECNIATNSEISMQKMADTLIELINPKAKIIQDESRLRPGKSEVFRLFGDNTKIIEHTNWKVEYTLEQGLQETINWFSNKENLKQYKADIYNV